MTLLDKSIPYKNIIMKISSADVHQVTSPALPEGFRFRLFTEGDEAHWARIETSVLEFAAEEDARAYFCEAYLPYLDELRRRCVFIINQNGLPIATATAWFSDRQSGFQASLHWVSVCPGYQGLGLGKTIVKKALTVLQELDPGEDVWLHTQTWSHVAVRLYFSLGFRLMKSETLKTTSSRSCDEKNDFPEAMDVLKTVYDGAFWEELARTAK